MRPHLFPDFMLSEFRSGVVCDKCSQSGQMLTFHVPEIKRKGVFVEIWYRYKCTCGWGSALRVELPLLLFGYVLARLAMIDTFRRRLSKSTVPVLDGRCKQFFDFVRDFENLFEEYSKIHTAGLLPPDKRGDELAKATPNSPTELDRLRFNLQDEDWREFLRRMGFGADEGSGER